MNAHESSEGLVGRSLLRREDEHLLRGRGRFLDDLPEPRNTLHLAFVMSPHAHARIVGIDADAALALPGVVAVPDSVLPLKVMPGGSVPVAA